MSNSRPRIAIIGLGMVGGSIGLALRGTGIQVTVVGHDKDLGTANQAKKLGAVDQVEWRLIPAIEEADLVVVSTPMRAIGETLGYIGPHLPPGAIVMDTGSLKAPVMAWAEESLPDSVHFVGTDPIVGGQVTGGGLASARADLFEKGIICVTPSPRAEADAIRQVTNLVGLLGASPLFVDPAEHDGLVAGVDQLPALLGLALLETVLGQPTWRELRKVAGPAYETGTGAALVDAAGFSAVTMSNRDNAVRWIDNLTASLVSIRDALVAGDGEELGKRFEEAQVGRGKWLQDRAQGNWDERGSPDLPTKPSMTDTFFGTFWRRKSKEDK